MLGMCLQIFCWQQSLVLDAVYCLFLLIAWDLAVILMELGEKAVITAAPRFAYGEEGRYSNCIEL